MMVTVVGAGDRSSAAVWLCGSRTGLAAVGVSVAIAAWEGVAHWRSMRASIAHRHETRPGDRRGRRRAGRRDGRRCCADASTHTVIARGTWTYIPFYGDKGINDKRQRAAVGAIWVRPGGDRDDQGASDRRRRCRHVPRAVDRLRQGRRLHHSSARQRAELVASSSGGARPCSAASRLLCVVLDLRSADVFAASRWRSPVDRTAARRADRIRASRRCSACRRNRSRS